MMPTSFSGQCLQYKLVLILYSPELLQFEEFIAEHCYKINFISTAQVYYCRIYTSALASSPPTQCF